MPPPLLHNALYQLFQVMAITGTTTPNRPLSNTILLNKKNNPYNLDIYHRPITLANVVNKLCASCLTIILAMDHVETHKSLASLEQEGFRAGRSYFKDIPPLSLCIEDTHTHDKDILCNCYAIDNR